MNASLAKWSACLTTNHEIVSSIPGNPALDIIIMEDLVWNEVASWGQQGSKLLEK